MTRVVTAGETMALLDPVDDGELELDGLLGALVRAALAGEGVDLRWVVDDPGAPTGLFYTVLFDPNYRPVPWDAPEAAAAAMDPVLEHVDWYAAAALRGTGDWETLPRLDAVRELPAG